jgi:hypothetical protein
MLGSDATPVVTVMQNAQIRRNRSKVDLPREPMSAYQSSVLSEHLSITSPGTNRCHPIPTIARLVYLCPESFSRRSPGVWVLREMVARTGMPARARTKAARTTVASEEVSATLLAGFGDSTLMGHRGDLRGVGPRSLARRGGTYTIVLGGGTVAGVNVDYDSCTDSFPLAEYQI